MTWSRALTAQEMTDVSTYLMSIGPVSPPKLVTTLAPSYASLSMLNDNSIDNNAFSSSAAGDITIDFGALRYIEQVNVFWLSTSQPGYSVLLSEEMKRDENRLLNDKFMTTVYSTTAGSPSSDGVDKLDLVSMGKAQYATRLTLRLLASVGGAAYAIREVQVWGPPSMRPYWVRVGTY